METGVPDQLRDDGLATTDNLAASNGFGRNF
jgi:hypothetical protein